MGPNPALDRTLRVPELVLGEVNRATEVVAQAGGKSANVTRVLHTLGAEVTLVGPLGGETGNLVRAAAKAEGLRCRWTEMTAPTRICSTIVHDDGCATDVNESGTIDAAGWAALLDLVAHGPAETDVVILSGSMPGVATADPVGELLAALDPKLGLWVDTSGPALAQLVAGDRPLAMVKVNLDEATAVVGLDGERAEASGRSTIELGVRAVTALQQATGGVAVVTLGPHGAVLHDGGRCWHAVLAVDTVVNPTGSGDSFLAGLVFAAIELGCAWPEALRHALACAAANVGQLGAGCVDPEALPALRAATTITEITAR